MTLQDGNALARRKLSRLPVRHANDIVQKGTKHVKEIADGFAQQLCL